MKQFAIDLITFDGTNKRTILQPHGYYSLNENCQNLDFLTSLFWGNFPERISERDVAGKFSIKPSDISFSRKTAF